MIKSIGCGTNFLPPFVSMAAATTTACTVHTLKVSHRRQHRGCGGPAPVVSSAVPMWHSDSQQTLPGPRVATSPGMALILTRCRRQAHHVLAWG